MKKNIDKVNQRESDQGLDAVSVTPYVPGSNLGVERVKPCPWPLNFQAA